MIILIRQKKPEQYAGYLCAAKEGCGTGDEPVYVVVVVASHKSTRYISYRVPRAPKPSFCDKSPVLR